jgi:tRNA-specific 2-thiouridylase
MIVKKQQKKVAVGLSGGVDSSVAALLLKQQGYNVTGVYLKCYEKDGEGCSSDEDRVSAVEVCSQLKIRFAYQNFTKQYKDKVIEYFFAEYKKGRTPNPDIICNKDIKFGLFLDWAMKEGFDFIATGHYAGVDQDKQGIYRLLKGKDSSKDQSYFLYRLDQAQLSRSVFPLSEITKKQVRDQAKEAGLKTYNRPDSQGICFIGQIDVRKFLQQRIKPHKGKVVSMNGEEIGTHDGVWFYTIGQRHGFEVTKYYGLPLYVVGKNVAQNKLIVGFVKV